MARLRRREFLGALAATAAAPALGRAAMSPRLPIAFSTLGCPSWNWGTILEQADRLGYAAIELRGLEGEMDLPRCPEFQPSRLKESRDQVAARGLKISDLGSSAAMHEADPAIRAKHLDEGRRFVDLAHELGAPYVRVFPNNFVAGEDHRATIDRIAAGLLTLGDHAKGSGVAVLMESHGDFTGSADILQVLTVAASPNVGFLWDAHHTAVAGHETPAETFKVVGSFVRHTHLKDSRPEKDGVRYVLTGTGTVPVEDTVKTLVAAGYKGY
ncbi:MAG: sugar phosphate isomerase/epimerase family protein, partial [Vicinamibacteria bacterium]